MNIYYNRDTAGARAFVAIAAAMFVASPLLALPLIVFGVVNRYRGSLLLLAMLLGVIAYLSVPYQDLYRHSINFYYWRGRSFADITIAHWQMNGIICYLYCWMVNRGLSFDYVRAAEGVISFLLLAIPFMHKAGRQGTPYTARDLLLRLCAFYLFYDFFYTIAGLRYGMALSIYLHGWYQLIDHRRRALGVALMALAGAVHYGLLLLMVISWAFYSARLGRRAAVFGVLGIALLTSAVVTLWGNTLLGARLDWYFSEGSYTDSYSHITLFGAIPFFAKRLALLPYAVILYRRYDRASPWCRITLAWMAVTLAFCPSAVMFYRAGWVFMALGIYMLLDVERGGGKLPRGWMRWVVLGGILFTGSNCVSSHKMLINSRYDRMLRPLPVILQENYTRQWIRENIDETGRLRNGNTLL